MLKFSTNEHKQDNQFELSPVTFDLKYRPALQSSDEKAANTKFDGFLRLFEEFRHGRIAVAGRLLYTFRIWRT